MGAVFGIKALTDQPSPTTGNGVTYGDLQSQQNTAHTEAIVADACFGAAGAAAIAALVLYFARTKDAAPTQTAFAPTSGLGVRPLLAPSTGGLLLGGTF